MKSNTKEYHLAGTPTVLGSSDGLGASTSAITFWPNTTISPFIETPFRPKVEKPKKEHGISTSVFYSSIKITTIVSTKREAPSSPHLYSFNYRFLYPTKLFSFSETVSKYYFQSTSVHTFQRSRSWNLSFR